MDPAARVTSQTADGAEVTDSNDLLRRLVGQVTRPVRWDACMATLAQRVRGDNVNDQPRHHDDAVQRDPVEGMRRGRHVPMVL